MDELNITISEWEKYQPRKDLVSLTWFRVDRGLFDGQTYFHLKNEGIVLFIFLLSIAAKDNNPEINLSLDFIADKLKIKKDEILNIMKKLELNKLVHRSVQNRTDLSPTIQTDITNKQTEHNKHNSTLDFESAYFLYPLKKGKSAGMKRLLRDIKNEDDLELFKKSIGNYKADLSLNRTELKYTKHFSTFVSEWRDWIDHIPQQSKPKTQTVFDTARDQIEKIERGEL